MSTWGHEFHRIGDTVRCYFRAPPTRVWLVTYWRRIGRSQCRINTALTQAAAEKLAAEHGLKLPEKPRQLTIQTAPPQPF